VQLRAYMRLKDMTSADRARSPLRAHPYKPTNILFVSTATWISPSPACPPVPLGYPQTRVRGLKRTHRHRHTHTHTHTHAALKTLRSQGKDLVLTPRRNMLRGGVPGHGASTRGSHRHNFTCLQSRRIVAGQRYSVATRPSSQDRLTGHLHTQQHHHQLRLT
jgi:hypothetical protein